MQLHDFNGGIQPSGLFWIVQVPDSALTMEGLTVKLHVVNANVIDDFQFFAPGGVPATVSYDVTWTATSNMQILKPLSSDPMDPSNFAAQLHPAIATISFSGSEAGFSVKGTGSSQGIFAEMGTEQNGVFLGKP